MPELLTLKQATKNSIKIVNEISQPLKEQSGINFFAYIKQYDTGEFYECAKQS